MTMLKRAEKSGRKFLNPVPTTVGGLRMMAKILPLYLTNREERVPKVALGPFTTDATVYAKPPQSGLRITWMGHSSILLEIDGAVVLIDPVWDERASPATWFGPKRFFPPPLPLEELPRIDAVLISHDHYDHLGKQTIETLSRLPAASHTRWITSLGVGAALSRFGVSAERIVEMDWMDEIALTCANAAAPLHITALPARHFSGRSLSNRFETLWSSFVLKNDRHCIYYGADSGLWEGFTEIGATYGPFDLTMLEIGAFNMLWSDIHMGPDGAATVFEMLGGRGLLMPIHWGLFDLALHAWRQPIERVTDLADARGVKLWSPEPGTASEVILEQELRSGWWRAGR